MSFLALHLRTQVFRALLTYRSLEDQSFQFACVVLTCTYFGAIVTFHACQYKYWAPYSRTNDAGLRPPINKPATRKQVERVFIVHNQNPIDAGGMLLTSRRGNLSRDVA